MQSRYIIRTSKIVIKFLKKHPDIALIFQEKTALMRHSPLNSLLDTKKLINDSMNGYRLRIGKYRFLFIINDTEVFIYFYDAYSRGGIYK
jgi:mRNA interferase RelE/StbE